MLTTYPHLTWIDMSLEIADLGAQLRARYNLKTPDSILLATAIHSEASGFIGNDSKFKKVTELDILMLS
ncbi:MAG: type II toxin-antitoxin system VapC family toxin [Nitrospinae bacterium]|nr:type II toxin-antitoxin system VapC family toxin [Nitrospinota bacterium]